MHPNGSTRHSCRFRFRLSCSRKHIVLHARRAHAVSALQTPGIKTTGNKFKYKNIYILIHDPSWYHTHSFGAQNRLVARFVSFALYFSLNLFVYTNDSTTEITKIIIVFSSSRAEHSPRSIHMVNVFLICVQRKHNKQWLRMSNVDDGTKQLGARDALFIETENEWCCFLPRGAIPSARKSSVRAKYRFAPL